MHKNKSSASSNVIINLVILKLISDRDRLIVLICFMINGMTDPLEPITFPYLVTQTAVEFSFNNDLDRATFSINAFEIPIAFIGYMLCLCLNELLFLHYFLSIDGK